MGNTTHARDATDRTLVVCLIVCLALLSSYVLRLLFVLVVNNGVYQPPYPRGLISAFVAHDLGIARLPLWFNTIKRSPLLFSNICFYRGIHVYVFPGHGCDSKEYPHLVYWLIIEGPLKSRENVHFCRFEIAFFFCKLDKFFIFVAAELPFMIECVC